MKMYETTLRLAGDDIVEIKAITDKRPCDDAWGYFVMRGARYFHNGKRITMQQACDILGVDHLSYSAKDVVTVIPEEMVYPALTEKPNKPPK